ncbi:MAG: hypothetical protein M1267_05190 [Candidatus Thermoplasmatota archaeon]|jgi:hypothetical protein|nr:hypothetical protein [Candidatus Thermoplasmatota archaeon]MCL5799777.1 hypothetical protein [Candidatus Thermoplasmatota archaeon]
MAIRASVSRSDKESMRRKIWRRVRRNSYLVVAAIMVVVGLLGLNIYYPQYEYHYVYNDQSVTAYPVNASTLYFNVFLFHQSNFTFVMRDSMAVSYEIDLVSEFHPTGTSNSSLYYTHVAAGVATNNTRVVGWESTYSLEFYSVNVTSDSGTPFNVSVNQEFTFVSVQPQPVWLTVLSFSLILTGVMTAAIFITVRSKNEDRGKAGLN